MRTVANIPGAVSRNSSVYTGAWTNTNYLLADNGVPYYPDKEVTVGVNDSGFARWYVSYLPMLATVSVLDIRLVKNGVMTGSNLLGSLVDISTSGRTLYNNDWAASSGYSVGAFYTPNSSTGSTTFESTVGVSGGSVKVISNGTLSGARLVPASGASMTVAANTPAVIRVKVKGSGSYRLYDQSGTTTFDSGYVAGDANGWVTLVARRASSGSSATILPVVVSQASGTFYVDEFEVLNEYEKKIHINISETVETVKSNSFGIAVAFRSVSDGVTTNSEHIVMSMFKSSLPNDAVVNGIDLYLYATQGSTFYPPSYPFIGRLFNAKMSVTYNFDSDGMNLFGLGEGRGFFKAAGYGHKTEELERRYQYMVYSKGQFLGELNDVAETPTIRTALNSFPSDVKIDVPRNADSDYLETDVLEIVDDGEPEPLVTERSETIDTTGDTVKSFGTGTIIDVNNNVDIYEYYGNYEGFVLDDGEPLLFDDLNEMEVPIGSPEGSVYFSGYISKYDVTYGKDARKTSKLTMLSHTDEYNNILLEKTDEDFVTISGSDSSLFAGLGREPSYYPATDNSAVGQSFIFSGKKTLSVVYVKVKRLGASDMLPAQYPVVTMRLVLGNPADGGATLATVSTSIVQNTPYWQAFALPSDITLNASQRYSLIFTTELFLTGQYSAVYPVQFYSDTTYADGVAYYETITRNWKSEAPVWNTATGYDMQIRLATRGGQTLVPMYSKDPSTMFKDIIDFGRNRGSMVKYLENSIEMSGTVVSAKFNMQSLKEAIDAAISYSPTDWYWYIDQSDLTLYLNQRSEDVSHIFTLGKDIEELKIEKSMEDLVNEVYFTGGNATAVVTTPFENKTYQGGTTSTSHVASQKFMPEPYIDYKVYADYDNKSCIVAVYEYYNNATTPSNSPTFVESGKLTYRYDAALNPTLTQICVVARASDSSVVAPDSMGIRMVSDSNVYRHLVNNDSQSAYRKAMVKKTDARVTNSVSADIIANAEMERNPAPIHAATLSVIRNEHLERVHPGQLVGFRGFGNFIDDLQLVVMEVELKRDIMTLSLGAFAPKTSKRLEDLKRNLQILEQANNPDAPTTSGGV